MRTLSLFLALGAVAQLFSAELPPVLKPYAERFDRDRAALEAAGEAQLKPARTRYLATLGAAQKAAGVAGRSCDLDVLGTELDGVNAGKLPDAAPRDLPRGLEGDRRAYLAAAASVTHLVPPRVRELATTYLHTLAALESRTSRTKDPELIAALASEKQRALDVLYAAGGGLKNVNMIANGNFSEGEVGVLPTGWKLEASETPAKDAALVVEGSEHFLRFHRAFSQRRGDVLSVKDIPIPEKTRGAEFSVRMRVKGLTAGQGHNDQPGIHVTCRDVNDTEVGGAWATTKMDSPWRKFSGRVELPATAKTLRVALGPFGAAGTIDFDDVTVEFR